MFLIVTALLLSAASALAQTITTSPGTMGAPGGTPGSVPGNTINPPSSANTIPGAPINTPGMSPLGSTPPGGIVTFGAPPSPGSQPGIVGNRGSPVPNATSTSGSEMVTPLPGSCVGIGCSTAEQPATLPGMSQTSPASGGTSQP